MQPCVYSSNWIVFHFCLGWIHLAAGVRRCHDLNKNGWWVLLPIWNVIALLFIAGTEDDNRYGSPQPF